MYAVGASTDVFLYNCIVWENSDSSCGDDLCDLSEDCLPTAQLGTGSPEPDYILDHSDVQDSTQAGSDGNIDEDPVFADPSVGNYRLTSMSPVVPNGPVNGGRDPWIPADSYDVDTDSDTTELTPDLDHGDRDLPVTSDMGAYEFVADCVGDLDDDQIVSFADMLELLSAWGPCPGRPAACPEDLNGDDEVDFADVLILLQSWGLCAGTGPGGDTHAEAVAEADLDMSDWYDFEDCAESGTPAEQENCVCWMAHYIEVHYYGTCLCAPNCPGSDPWGNH